jgi:outer membrane protein
LRLNKESEGQQRLNVEQVRDQAQANVIQAWGQLQAAKAQVEAAIRQNDAAARALEGVRNEAHAGQRTTLDVLNAEQALVNARVSLIVAQHDRVVASYSLVSAVGRLSARELRLPVTIYDPMVHYQQVARCMVRAAHAGRTLSLCLILRGGFGPVEHEPELGHCLFGAVAARQ